LASSLFWGSQQAEGRAISVSQPNRVAHATIHASTPYDIEHYTEAAQLTRAQFQSQHFHQSWHQRLA
jgi:hypothetical protein